jgi:hypothetical protein
LTCHDDATRHTDDLDCIECHWPAAHAATPDANHFGGFEEMPLVLPVGATAVSTSTTTTLSGATTTTTAPAQPGRDHFARTGAELGLMAALSALLVGAGWALRRRRSAD